MMFSKLERDKDLFVSKQTFVQCPLPLTIYIYMSFPTFSILSFSHSKKKSAPFFFYLSFSLNTGCTPDFFRPCLYRYGSRLGSPRRSQKLHDPFLRRRYLHHLIFCLWGFYPTFYFLQLLLWLQPCCTRRPSGVASGESLL